MAGYIGSKAVSVNTTSATISDDLAVGDDATITGDLDVDGTTNLDVVDIDGAVNMATTALVTGVLTTTAATVFNGGFAANAGSTISTADNTAQLTLISTDADGSSGPKLTMFRNSGSPADGDALGIIDFTGEDSNGDETRYVAMFARPTDVTNGDEFGKFQIIVATDGVDKDYFHIDAGTKSSGSLVNGEIVFNEDSQDIDFRVEGNNSANLLFIDGGNDHICINTSTDAGGVLNIKTTDNTANLVLFSTDADASVGPVLDLYRDSSSPADGDIMGNINYKAENSASEIITYANIIGVLGDVTDGTEDGQLRIQTMTAGSNVNRISVDTTETVINNSSKDLDFRVESDGNANMLFVDGGNNRVGIGTNTPQVGTLHVHTATAGTVTASPQADDLVVESNTEAGITILSPDDQTARIRFSSPSTNTDVGGATIFYRQNINKMKVGTAVSGGVTELVSGADATAVSCDGNGAVTMPLQPSFQVRKSGNQNNLAANDSAQTITFDTEVFDGNSDFTGNTFTAPVTGKYMLSINTYLGSTDIDAAYILVGINTTLRNYYRLIAPKFTADQNYYGMNFSVVADMDAGDTAISIYQQNGGAAQVDIIASNGTQFSGYLLG
jgi:hypothetical protein